MMEFLWGPRPSTNRAARSRRRRGIEMLEGRHLLSHLHLIHPVPAATSKTDVPHAFLHTPIAEGKPLAEHIHPHLTIVIKGRPQTVPANIGHVPYVGWLPIHTHTPDGTIHIESTVPYTFRLKDFFDVWGQTFNRHDILGHITGGGHQIVMTVDGRPSQAYENLVLRDLQQIVIKYT